MGWKFKDLILGEGIALVTTRGVSTRNEYKIKIEYRGLRLG
jgi:hypothetical protein